MFNIDHNWHSFTKVMKFRSLRDMRITCAEKIQEIKQAWKLNIYKEHLKKKDDSFNIATDSSIILKFDERILSA